VVGGHDTPRILSVCGGDTASIRLAALVQMSVPGAPASYDGDEIGMTGSIDPFARAAFPWSRPDTWDDGLRAYVDVPEIAGRVLQPAALPGDEPCEPLDVGASSIVITIPARSGRVFVT
jgi:glycosidase